jgi:hypothetical protein
MGRILWDLIVQELSSRVKAQDSEGFMEKINPHRHAALCFIAIFG